MSASPLRVASTYVVDEIKLNKEKWYKILQVVLNVENKLGYNLTC